MPDIRAAVFPAGGTAAALLDRALIQLVGLVQEVQLAVIGVHVAVAAVPAGIDAVEKVDAALHAFQDIRRRADAHQVSGLSKRQMRHDDIQDMVHFLVALAHGQPADRVTRQIQFGDFLRVADADVLKGRALVDAEQKLLSVDGLRQAVQTFQFGLAAAQPAGGAVHAALHVILRGRILDTLVEGHRDGGGEVRLDLHALLRPHEYLPAVHVRVEMDTLFFDLAQVRQRKDLKAAGIRQDRPVPVHEFMQAAQFIYDLVSRPHVQMIGVRKLHLAADGLQILRGDRAFDGGSRAHVHKDRRLDDAVHGLKAAALGPPLGFQ